MPLTGDPKKDIPELMKSGRPQKQAVAIALKEKRGDDDCDEDIVADDDDRSSEGHAREAARLKDLAEREKDPAKKKKLQEQAEFHGKEVGIADAKKDEVEDLSLLKLVERIRHDMQANQEAIDRLAGKSYTISSRIRRIEEQQ